MAVFQENDEHSFLPKEKEMNIYIPDTSNIRKNYTNLTQQVKKGNKLPRLQMLLGMLVVSFIIGWLSILTVARVNDIARAEEDMPDRLTDLVAEIIEEQSKQNLDSGTRIREDYHPSSEKDHPRTDERNRRNPSPGSHGPLASSDFMTCPELDPLLGTFDSLHFDHMARHPQCMKQIRPKLTLHTQTNPSSGCVLTNQDKSQGGSHFYEIPLNCQDELQDLEKVVFLVHGFTFLDSELNKYKEMEREILKDNRTGVVFVDWLEGSRIDFSHIQINSDIVNTALTIFSDFIKLGPYHQAAANTRYIGAALATVTENIRKAMSPNPFFHCIGHSLGAHACGFLGKALKKLSAEPLDRITGLDPAGPLFLESVLTAGLGVSVSTSTRLAAEDAKLVDSVHTDSNWLGSFTKTGHMDFYIGENKTHEDKFGYSQPGTECFFGSHALSKDIFLATMQNTCNVGKVCSNINENRTDNCQDIKSVKFGYNMDSSTPITGSFPVTTDKHAIRCPLGEKIKRLKYENSLPASLMKLFSKFKGACSLIRYFVKPIQEMTKIIENLVRQSQERLKEQKIATDNTVAEMITLGSKFNVDQEQLYQVHEELQLIDLAYENHKRTLTGLATRTKRTTKRLIRALKSIRDPTKENSGKDFAKILKKVKDLLNYSNEVLPKAITFLNEIAERYSKVNTGLKKAEDKINKFKKVFSRQVGLLESGTKASIAEQSTWRDNLRTIGGMAQILGSVAATAVNMFTPLGWIEIPIQVLAILGAGNGIYDIASEKVELDEEKATVKLYKDTVLALNAVKLLYETYFNNITTISKKVENEKKDIAGRNNILWEWNEIVGSITDTYAQDDYKVLEDVMMNEEIDELDDAIEDFEELRDVSIKYLEYDQEIPTMPPKATATTQTP